MSRADKIIGIFCAAVVSLAFATLACFAALSILTRLPAASSLLWWSLASITRLAVVMGSLFLFTFCASMALYLRALRRAR